MRGAPSFWEGNYGGELAASIPDRVSHKNPQGMFIAPTFGQVEKIAFEYLREETAVFPGVKYNAAKLRCEIPHPQLGKISIYLLSGSNESSENLRGMYADAVVLGEFQDIPAKVFPQIIRPALADRRGKYLWIGTPKSDDQFKAIYDQGVA